MKFLLAIPILAGFVLDAIFGDPYTMPHPIRLIGTLISRLEICIRKHSRNLKYGGLCLMLAVLLCSTGVPLIILVVCYRVNALLGLIAESIFCYYLLAARCLCDESMKVCHALEQHDTEQARYAVSMIVGRDTKPLDEAGIIRAAVETVAENTSDGVTAPLLYMAFGGAAGGFFYKAVNTMDSMLGYQNEKYREIGFFPAKFDDVLNYLPSRITAVFMTASAFLLQLDGKNACRIWKRDRRNHASPNSAQTEAVCAGALHVRLAGDAWYFGELHKKKYIGDDDRPIETADIRRANGLMYLTAVLMLAVSALIRICITGVIFS